VPRRWSSVQALAVEPGGEPVGATDPRTSGAAVVERR
jgi:gamma-glutamyltranspeptidase